MSYVKYRLASLNRENGGFQFEPLATDLLHATYASNIVPASGPVGPGDRGEDARTHATYLMDSSDMFRVYRPGPNVKEQVYFAYSIDANWRRKLKGDVAKILSSGLGAEKVVFVTNQTIRTSTRQDTQRALGAEYGVPIEILDGNWIASQLESDHYALAVKYLGCDRAADPQIEAVIRRVLDLKVGGMSAEDAAEVERLEADVRYRGKYENRRHQLVLDLMRLGDLLCGYEEQLETAVQWYEEALHECEGLWDFVTTADVYYAYFHALFRRPAGRPVILQRLPEFISVIRDKDIVDYYGRVLTWLLFLAPHAHDEQIDTQEFRCLWDEFRGFLRDYDISGRSAYTSTRIQELSIWMDLLMAIWEGEDPTGPLDELSRLLDVISEITIYPVGRLCEMLSVMSPLFDLPQYETVYARAEGVTAQRESGFRVAELRRNRAVAHFDRGEWDRAAFHLNIVKALWRSDETLRGSLLSSLMLARCYRELGLFRAAKYEVAQCVYLATLLPAKRELDLVSAAYAELHCAALKLGYILTAVDAGLWHLRASVMWDIDEEARDRFMEYFERNLLVLLPRLLISNRELHDEVMRRLSPERLPLLELYEETFLTSDEDFEQRVGEESSAEEQRSMRQAVMRGDIEPVDVPIIDEVSCNQVEFNCAGVRVCVRHEARYDLRLVAETIAGWIPFLLLSRPTLKYDLAWIEERVEIVVEQGSGDETYTISHVPDNYRLVLRLAISPRAARAFREPPFDGVFEVCLALFAQMLDMCTIAPTQEVLSALDTLAGEGEFDRWTKQAPYAWAVHTYLPRVVGYEEDQHV